VRFQKGRTSFRIMVLRLCLNEAPKYLRVEAKGF
jgi:hypothetical protein